MKLVTIKQAELLRELGFGEPTARYAYKFPNGYRLQSCVNYGIGTKNMTNVLSVPTVDEALDWFRRKFNVHVWTLEPYVSMSDNKIYYTVRIKWCNKHGWNFRRYVGKSIQSSDVYAAKRMAIRAIITFIKKNLHGNKKKRRH
jgi:hypothetical protein